MYLYVNKRVELAQRGIALQKIYVLLLLSCTAQLGYYCCCLNFHLSVHSLRMYATCINRVYIWIVYCCDDKMCFPLIKLSWLTERKNPRSFLPSLSVSPHFIQSHILCRVHMRVSLAVHNLPPVILAKLTRIFYVLLR